MDPVAPSENSTYSAGAWSPVGLPKVASSPWSREDNIRANMGHIPGQASTLAAHFHAIALVSLKGDWLLP